MPTSGIRIVSETNLTSYNNANINSKSSSLENFNGAVDVLNCPITLDNNVLIMENIQPTTTAAAVAVKTFVNLDAKNWGGGYSTILTPGDMAAVDTPVFAEIQANMVGGRRGGGRRSTIKAEDLSVEEEDRLRQRRERNKQAAARCRKRRVDQTDCLQKEVDDWEEKKRLLEEEIHSLQTQREELQFILSAHNQVCTKQQQQKQQNNRTNQPTTTLLNIPSATTLLNIPSLPKVIVKSEEEVHISGDTYVHHMTHEEALSNTVVPDVISSSSSRPPTTTTAVKPARPASLSLAIRPQCLRSIEGVPIETPTNVFSSLNFDALMDGRTGLTPTNVLTPVSLSMCLQTPVMMGGGGFASPSCSLQQRHNTADMMSPGSGSHKQLVSL